MDEKQPVGPAVRPLEVRPLERLPQVGRSVALHPLDPARDLAALYRASHGFEGAARVWTYMGYGPFQDEEAMGAWLAICAASSDPLFFTVRDARGGEALGMASYLARRPEHGSVEIGHLWYGPASQRGITNTECVYLLLRNAFNNGFRRLEWKCDALNARSRAAALRLGFSFEGIFRQHLVVKGRNRDTAWFSMLDGEWPAVRDALETWLDWDGPTPPALASLRAPRS